MTRLVLVGAIAALIAAATGVQAVGARPDGADWRTMRGRAPVIVSRGQAVEVAFVGSATDFPEFTRSFANAVRMAVALHPTIRGFRVKINPYSAPCFSGPDPTGANATVAAAVVGNAQNVAVIGQLCSPPISGALPVYERAGVVVVSGSATQGGLSAYAPSVFDRTIVADPNSTCWYATVTSLLSDLAWRSAYQEEFGSAPADFSDLYFDAARLLLDRLERVSRIVDGNLVVDRAALAVAVRHTVNFPGVSCSITLDPATGDRLR